MNFFVSFCQTQNALHIFETQDQIVSLMINCFVTGGIFGFIFSFLDIEDRSYWELGKWFFFEEKICTPIGCISGMLAGFINEILRSNAGRFQLTLNVQDDPFDQEI